MQGYGTNRRLELTRWSDALPRIIPWCFNADLCGHLLVFRNNRDGGLRAPANTRHFHDNTPGSITECKCVCPKTLSPKLSIECGGERMNIVRNSLQLQPLQMRCFWSRQDIPELSPSCGRHGSRQKESDLNSPIHEKY